MASRIFYRTAARRLLASSSAAVAIGAAATGGDSSAPSTGLGTAQSQFDAGWGYIATEGGPNLVTVPKSWGNKRTFELCNQYPTIAALQASGELPPFPVSGSPDLAELLTDAPWLAVDFTKDPHTFCKVIKDHCFKGFVGNKDNPSYGDKDNYNPFLPKSNPHRSWYHAPWMHWNENGREPLNGLTYERATPPTELASTQTSQLQTWACGFYNKWGALSFGEIWKDPSNPKWNAFSFDPRTCVFKILMTNASNDEVPSMVNAPGFQAVIADTSSGPPKNALKRNQEPSTLRLLQIDFAVRDPRSPIGWVFGTFMYNGYQTEKDPWHRIMPVGLIWGNDPTLTVDNWDNGKGQQPQESWINESATKLLKQLGGYRDGWGYCGRLNGPADYFRSACSSCHSIASKAQGQTTKADPNNFMAFDHSCPSTMTIQQHATCAQNIPIPEQQLWFQNLKRDPVTSIPEPFTPGDTSADYSLQLQIGYYNYQAWNLLKNPTILQRLTSNIPFTPAYNEVKLIEAKRSPTRNVGMTDPAPHGKKFTPTGSESK